MSRIVLIAVLAASVTAFAQETAPADPAAAAAGVAFEWPAPGSWNAPRKALSDNLLRGGDAEGKGAPGRVAGWHKSSWMGSKASPDYPLPGTPTSDIADGKGRRGGRAFHLRMSADAAPIVSAVWSTNVKTDKPGPYRLSGWAKCGSGSKDGGNLEVVFQSRKPSGELCGEHWQRQRSKKTLVPVPPGGWHQFHVDAVAMDGIGRISLIFAQRGPGELHLDDLSLVKTEADTDVHVIARTTGVLDGTVAVGSRELLVGGMWAKNENGRKVKSPRLELDLPAGVRLVPPDNKAAQRFREQSIGGRVRASIPWTSRYNLSRPSFFTSVSQLYCLYADLPPRSEPYEAKARLTAQGYEGPWWSFQLLILPRIERVKAPKRVLLAGNVPGELGGRAAREFVEAYARWGMNAALCWKETPDMAAALKKHTLYMINIDWFWRDNFRIMHKKWTKELVPKDAWWVGRNGDGWGMCPEYIAQGMMTDTILKPYYRKAFVESDLYAAWATNWEPNLWHGKGCFCPRCKKAFAKFANLREAEILPLDGKGLLKKHTQQWRLYRRDLNNRLMWLAHRIFDDLGKERGKLIPAFLWVGPGAITDVKAEMDILPVLRDCECIAGWSYAGVNIAEGPKGEVNHLKVAEQTEQVMEKLRALNKRSDLKYFHCVLGSFGSLVTTPEEMELDFLSSVLARPWCISAWALPTSYDYRYATAFARACRVIAAHEDMIYGGKKSGDVPIVPLSPTHKNVEEPSRLLIKRLEAASTLRNLWARSFTKGNRRLYAIFNFDRRNPVDFTLKPEVSSDKWILHDPVNRRAYTSAPGGQALTPSDVRNGIRLRLGAARATFLLLEPYRQT